MSRQNISEAFNSLAELEKKQELAKRPVKKQINESVNKSNKVEELNESSLYDRAMKWFKTHDVRSDMEEACGKKKVNEDFDRDLESKILEMCEEGVLDWEAVARELLREASEDDLEYFCRVFDIDFDLEECNEK